MQHIEQCFIRSSNGWAEPRRKTQTVFMFFNLMCSGQLCQKWLVTKEWERKEHVECDFPGLPIPSFCFSSRGPHKKTVLRALRVLRQILEFGGHIFWVCSIAHVCWTEIWAGQRVPAVDNTHVQKQPLQQADCSAVWMWGLQKINRARHAPAWAAKRQQTQDDTSFFETIPILHVIDDTDPQENDEVCVARPNTDWENALPEKDEVCANGRLMIVMNHQGIWNYSWWTHDCDEPSNECLGECIMYRHWLGSGCPWNASNASE
jgi:hypothetical protein